MVRRAKKRLGKDAKVSILAKYLHPSRLVSSTLPNIESNHRVENCVIIGTAVKKVHRRDQVVVLLKHDSFKTNDGESEEIYGVPRWYKVTEEGPSDYYFDIGSNGQVIQGSTNDDIETGDIELELPSIVTQINHRGFLDGDLLQLDGQIEVDDDNLPAPENVPIANRSNANDIFVEWGHDGVCQRRQAGGQNMEASLFNFGSHSGVPTILQTFEMMFPKEYIEQVIIKQTNKKLEQKMTYGEFFIWMGLWFFMGTTNFGDRRDFWSTKSIDAFEGTPYRFNGFMSRFRFENILSALTITDKTPPTYTD